MNMNKNQVMKQAYSTPESVLLRCRQNIRCWQVPNWMEDIIRAASVIIAAMPSEIPLKKKRRRNLRRAITLGEIE